MEARKIDEVTWFLYTDYKSIQRSYRALGISILLTDFFRSKGNQHLFKISICPQISAPSLSNISVPHSLHFKGELQKHTCLRLLSVKAK